MGIFDFGKQKEPKLFQLLLDGGFIDRRTLKQIKDEMEIGERPIENILLDHVSREALLQVRVDEFGGKFMPIDLVKNTDQFDPEQVKIFPVHDVIKYKTAVLQKKGQSLAVAMVNPQDDFSAHVIEEETGCSIMVKYICLATDLDKFTARMFGSGKADEAAEEVSRETGVAVSSPAPSIYSEDDVDGMVGIRQIVDAIIQKAIDKGASDVHVEPSRNDMRIRYRVDGILNSDPEIEAILNREKRDRNLHNAILNVVKNRSGASGKDMRLDEREKPQDGRIYIPQLDLDLRVSVIPSMHGESLVIRLHNREVGEFTLDKLGFEKKDFEKFSRLIKLPYGMLLVSGPTGSGKTTTLYSVMSLINSPTKKILSIEDPIEYSIEGAIQAQTNPAKDFTFDQGLRAFLRHDPDIIMVGEIRDTPTAAMAVEASLTGHLVLSTIHANDAVSTVIRLKDLGVDPRLVTSVCIATLAQRLVRRNCPFCSEPHPYSTRIYKAMNKYGLEYNTDELKKGKGCDICKGSGYQGRIGIFELMEMTFEMKELILREATQEEMEALARTQGMRTLLEDALQKVARGITTEEEVWRVTLLEKG